jgi:hypothetical protein
MKLTVHVTLSGDDDTETVVREVFALTREALTPDTLGLGLAEAKDLLAAVQDTLVTAQVSAAVAARTPARTAQPPTGTRTSTPSWCAACSARCAWTARGGGTAPARCTRPARSARWQRCCPNGPPRSCPICRPASPGWSPTVPRPACCVSSCHWAGPCTRPPCGLKCTPPRNAWKTNSVTSGPASSTPAHGTGRSCPARSCRWSWDWTAATCTPPPSAPGGMAGSR